MPEAGAGELGIVLRTTPLRESDLLVVLYTVGHGRITAVARGGRKSQRRFAGALQLLVLGRYQLGRRPRGELWSLESADVVREWHQLASDVVAVAHASYVVELAGALLPPETPDPHALELVVALWDSLVDGGPSPAALRAVELALLELAGHRPSLDACAACGQRELAAAVFDPLRGGAICRACAASSRNPDVRPLDARTLAYLCAVAASDSPGAARALDRDAAFEPADRIAGREAIVTMVQGLVGRPLKSLEYIAKLGAAGRRP
jgi:DNA repair protein RecO (recombination protein O)